MILPFTSVKMRGVTIRFMTKHVVYLIKLISSIFHVEFIGHSVCPTYKFLVIYILILKIINSGKYTPLIVLQMKEMTNYYVSNSACIPFVQRIKPVFDRQRKLKIFSLKRSAVKLNAQLQLEIYQERIKA